MEQQNQSTVGPPSPKSLKNFRRARAHAFYVGEYFVEWKAWTEQFHVWPKVRNVEDEFWNQGRVWWFRCYWLTGGLSITRSLPERRAGQVDYEFLNRRLK